MEQVSMPFFFACGFPFGSGPMLSARSQWANRSGEIMMRAYSGKSACQTRAGQLRLAAGALLLALGSMSVQAAGVQADEIKWPSLLESSLVAIDAANGLPVYVRLTELKEATRNIDKLQQGNEALKRQVEEQAGVIQALRRTGDEQAKALADLRRGLEQQGKVVDKSAGGNQVNDLQRSVAQLQKELAAVQRDASAAQQAAKSAQQDAKSAQQEARSARDSAGDAQRSVSDLSRRVK